MVRFIRLMFVVVNEAVEHLLLQLVETDETPGSNPTLKFNAFLRSEDNLITVCLVGQDSPYPLPSQGQRLPWFGISLAPGQVPS